MDQILRFDWNIFSLRLEILNFIAVVKTHTRKNWFPKSLYKSLYNHKFVKDVDQFLIWNWYKTLQNLIVFYSTKSCLKNNFLLRPVNDSGIEGLPFNSGASKNEESRCMIKMIIFFIITFLVVQTLFDTFIIYV